MLALASSGDSGRGFYEQALHPDERPLYRRARDERGLAEEIALLRLHLYLALRQRDDRADPAVVQTAARLIDLLIKALRAQGATAGDDAALEQVLAEEAARILSSARQI